MLDETAIEQRLAILEQEVANLKKQSHSTNWIENLTGSISDEEAFLEALKYGREFRDSDKPVGEDSKTASAVVSILLCTQLMLLGVKVSANRFKLFSA
ncbi:MAG: hypothetical protein MUC48_15990 [Leptolyngbya sp. Prado105]|jgi:hypothetical protein|nr:hypothetical protein [Leptolyngbya sp. Prado105]